MILVVGATGMLGGMITQQLLAQGKDVRILVRHNSPSEAMVAQGMATSAQALIDAGAQPVYGDMKDSASLDLAVNGVDTIVTTANSVLRGGEDTVETVDRQGNLNLVEAAKTAGVKHFVFTSVLGADPASSMPLIRCKAEVEAALRESGMIYTILSPNLIAEVWVGVVVGAPLQAGQPITLVGEARRKHSFVSMVDVAAFGVTAVDNPAAHDATIIIGGPEALSWRDIVAEVGETIGQELPVRFVQPGEPVPFVPEAVQQSMAVQDTYDSPLPMAEIADTYGVTLTPMATVLQRMFGRN
ncbi:MAG: SDR family oxidoreductase [Halieaceae bacterium]|nr:SDR family oxidoreductase [Halieaceae bacterium]